jgi:pimeloyl-ACP methyl ester carboxylesterase
MPFFDREGSSFRFREESDGLPFVFQHGLGGDLDQPFGVYRPATGVRLIGFDMRGHGETRPLGDVNKLTIADLADDLAALLDHLEISQAVIGGISLGSAVAVKFALTHPGRVLGLVLSRPAWLDRPLPENVRLYAMIANFLREFGTKDGVERFRLSPEFEAMESSSPDCARSLLGQFESPRALECVARLERLASDRLCDDLTAYSSILVPALILGNHQDPIHPWFLAARLAQIIPAAEMREITPKSVSIDRHAADVQLAVDGFLTNRFLPGKGSPC